MTGTQTKPPSSTVLEGRRSRREDAAAAAFLNEGDDLHARPCHWLAMSIVARPEYCGAETVPTVSILCTTAACVSVRP